MVRAARLGTWCALAALCGAVVSCSDDGKRPAGSAGAAGVSGTGASGGGGGSGAAGGSSGGASAICHVTGGVTDFSFAHALGEGYWYSRYNLGSLLMKSADGVGFMPPAGAPDLMVQMSSDTLSTAVVPTNPSLVSRVYTYGNPALINPDDADPMNLADEQWTPIAAADQPTTTSAAWAWTMMKILEWDKQFHVDAHFGVPGQNDIPGAQERFSGLVLFAEAMMMMSDWMTNPGNYSTSDLGGQYAGLMAMSNFAIVLNATALPHSASNRYKTLAENLAPMMGMDLAAMKSGMSSAMGQLFGSLGPATNIHDCAVAVQSLTWFLGVAPDATTKSAARDKLVANADLLIGRSATSAAELGYLIRGAVDAWRITTDSKYLDAAVSAYQTLEAAYDCEHGVFTNQSEYTPEDVAGIVGGLNAILNFVADQQPGVAFDRVTAVLTGFWEATMNIAALQLSAPPVAPPDVSDYEKQASELFHRYPTMPEPHAAGGTNGRAPVFAASVSFNSATGTWTADAARFDSAGGMHLANEALWLHTDEVSGFPTAP